MRSGPQGPAGDSFATAAAGLIHLVREDQPFQQRKNPIGLLAAFGSDSSECFRTAANTLSLFASRGSRTKRPGLLGFPRFFFGFIGQPCYVSARFAALGGRFQLCDAKTCCLCKNVGCQSKRSQRIWASTGTRSTSGSDGRKCPRTKLAGCGNSWALTWTGGSNEVRQLNKVQEAQRINLS